MLQQYGASVTAVPSGRDALETIARDGADVLLSDIQMPEEDGDWLIAQLRGLQDRRRPQLPAIAVTAYGGSEERQRLLAAGFQRHVAKPVDAEKLASVVAELVAPRRS
jgi:CheY-like chemotaxis protein